LPAFDNHVEVVTFKKPGETNSLYTGWMVYKLTKQFISRMNAGQAKGFLIQMDRPRVRNQAVTEL